MTVSRCSTWPGRTRCSARPGGTWSAQPATDPVRAAVSSVQADPGARHTIGDLAGRSGLSARHLQRRFTAEMGVPPAAYVERVRVEAARRALAEGDEPVEALARRLGFGTAETLRRAFHRHVGVAPSDYRARFRGARVSTGTNGMEEYA